jgi:peptidoglycan/xylan/chitin deacetylase (PgdA/CDA1 family)
MRGHLLVDVPLVAACVSLFPLYGLLPLAWATPFAVGIHAWGVVDPRSSLYLPVWWRLPAGSPDVALTFDDGPHPEVTPRVLDQLAAAGQKATFFVIGENVRRAPALVRRMLDEGHAVGLHSHTHSWLFNCWPPGRVQRDLEACAAAVAEAGGRPAPTLFRPPVGLKNPVVGFVAGRLGLTTVTWSVRGLDTGGAPPKAVLARLERGLAPRAILTLHDGCEPRHPRPREQCLAVLSPLLERLRERGLRSVALAPAAAGRGIVPLA